MFRILNFDLLVRPVMLYYVQLAKASHLIYMQQAIIFLLNLLPMFNLDKKELEAMKQTEPDFCL